MSNNIKDNLATVRSRIKSAASAAGRTFEDIRLIAVTKTFPVSVIDDAIAAGITDIGENRIQEAREKLPQISAPVRRHLIGHLQRNKVKYAVKLFDMIQSVDSITLAEEINARCSKMQIQMPILIEVNTSGEEAKFGCRPQEAVTMLTAIDRLPNLSARGFMTIAAYSKDENIVRPCFRLLKEIYDTAQTLQLQYGQIDTLSMGMSSDYEIAIEEGATMVRVGSALFGSRNR